MSAATAHLDDARLPPAMKQYAQFKRQYPDYILLFRMGDFYEMFWEDAKRAAAVLNITLTTRDKNSENPIPMAGVPFHSIEGYLRRLIAAGFRVALAEQTEDAKQAKGLIKRDVTRLITPGTLTDEGFLEGRADNYLAAISLVMTRSDGHRAGLAWTELSTGGCWAMSGTEAEIIDQLARLSVAEVLVPETVNGTEPPIADRIRSAGIRNITVRPGWQHTPHHAIELIRRQWRVQSAAGFGFAIDDDAGLTSVGAILSYLEETQRSLVPHLKPPRPHVVSDHLLIDPQTYRALEIERTTRTGSTEGSLLDSIDRTRTTMGARLIRQWLRFPLADIDHIRARQASVRQLVDSSDARAAVVAALDDVCDIERIVARINVARVSPRDLFALGRTLGLLPELLDRLASLTLDRRAESGALTELQQLRDLCARLHRTLSAAIRDDPAPHLREGGVIASGYDPELDRLRELAVNAQAWLADYQQQLQAETQISSLKVAYNKVFGYYIEVTDAHRAKVPSTWSRRQTVKNAERYITEELKKFEDESLTARERSIRLEAELFEQLRQSLLPETAALQELASAVARLDVTSALASIAVEQRYVCPEIVEDRVMHIIDGRHPVLEQQVARGAISGSATQFVANDTHFEPHHTLSLITGPNMAGKSTYIRQTALITLLSHIGSFVPARSAVIGICDRIFSRIGASDEIHSGASTFMVEMTETANILNNATDRSLIVLDEIGRGTSTLDGLSLAWAIAEHLASRVRARTLFATHYHELTQLADSDPGVRNFNVSVREWEDQVVFLHRIVEGGTDRSYGIHVGRLAGLPREVLDRARDLLGQLAVQHVGSGPVVVSAAKPASSHTGSDRADRPGEQLSLFAFEPSGLTQALDKIDPDELSPREAHELLREWKRKFG